MAYQSEAALEQQFVEQLNKQEYTTVAIPDYDALVENFKVQFEAFNAPKMDTPITDKEWERIFNLMLGKSSNVIRFLGINGEWSLGFRRRPPCPSNRPTILGSRTRLPSLNAMLLACVHFVHIARA